MINKKQAMVQLLYVNAALGCEFEPHLGQRSFQRLTRGNATGVTFLPPKPIWKSSRLL